ncbi:MAG: hypothetical protein EHM24_04210, partial [Acidobacteria bacterium]
MAKRAGNIPPISTGDAGAVRVEARQALDHAAARFHGDEERPHRPAAGDARPAVGDRVSVAGLGLEGVLLGLHGDEAEVDMLGKRVRARLPDLRVVSKAAAGQKPAGRVSVNVQVQSRPDMVIGDLHLIGCTVEEALGRTERYLDEMLLSDQRTVRLIHGYGTGQLRRAIAEYLRNHPLVARYDQAPPEQGGGGVTVVELKE